jgi:hypothetical protein
MSAAKRVLLISGAAPYLGGPATWAPLRQAAPDMEFVEVDPLDFADAAAPERAVRAGISLALERVDAAVAHFTAARAVIETVAAEKPGVPVVLLSPLVIARRGLRLRIADAILGLPPFARLLNAFACSKRRRLTGDRRSVERQLRFFVRDDALSEDLLGEAQARLCDERTASLVARTAELARAVATPIEPRAIHTLHACTVIVGSGRIDRAAAKRTPATVLPQVRSAPMLDAPACVAAVLRALG